MQIFISCIAIELPRLKSKGFKTVDYWQITVIRGAHRSNPSYEIWFAL